MISRFRDWLGLRIVCYCMLYEYAKQTAPGVSFLELEFGNALKA